MPAMEVVLLGTGSPLPNPDRCGAGQVIIAGDERVLVDCGWGAARRLFAAGVPPMLIDTACFTHMHSDHITDMPDFMIMRWVGGSQKPLHVYGPEGTQRMIDGFLSALADDIRFRFAHHGDKLSQDGIKVVVHEVPATPDRARIAEVGAMQIDSFEVDHFPVVPALGFRFDASGASVVISGDTKKCDNLTRASQGADVLVSEALSENIFKIMRQRLVDGGNTRQAAVMDDVPDYHVTTTEVAEMARDAGVKKLVLSHLIPSIPNEGPLADVFAQGIGEIFKGELVVGRDLMRFAVGG